MILRTVGFQFLTDVSGQRIGPRTHEDRAEEFVPKRPQRNHHSTPRRIPEQFKFHLHRRGSLKQPKERLYLFNTDECLNSEIKGQSTPTFILILKSKRFKPVRQSSMSSCATILRQAVLTQDGRRNYILYLKRNVDRVQLKCDGTRRRMGGEVKGKLANGLGSQYSSHCLVTWCIQHYYR